MIELRRIRLLPYLNIYIPGLMCKNWALWSAGMSNSVMEKTATSVLLLDNLLAQNILYTSLCLQFFSLSSSLWRLFAHLCDTLPAEWNMSVSMQWN